MERYHWLDVSIMRNIGVCFQNPNSKVMPVGVHTQKCLKVDD